MIADKLKQLYDIKTEIKSAVEYLYPNETITDDFSTYPELIRNYKPAETDNSDYALVLETENPVVEWHAVRDKNITSNASMYWGSSSYEKDINYQTSNLIKDVDFDYFDSYNSGSSGFRNLAPVNDECSCVKYINYYKLTDENRRYFSFYRLPNVTEIERIDATGCNSLYGLLSCAVSITELHNNWLKTETPELVTDLSYMFYSCQGLQEIDLSPLSKMTEVTDLSYMFSSCYALQNIDLTPLAGMTKVTSFSYMFTGCFKLEEIDLTPLSGMTEVTDLSYMFQTSSGFKKINLTPLSGMTKVTKLNYMFMSCNRLEEIDLSPLSGMSKVTSLNYMFNGCTNLISITFGDWKFEKTPTTNSLFSGCSNLKYITCPKSMYELLSTSSNFTNLENVTWYFSDEDE